MEKVSLLAMILFGLVTCTTVLLFYRALNRSKRFLVIAFAWMILQGIVSGSGFYTVTDTMPPRFLLLVVPPVLLALSLFFSQKGRRLMDHADPRWLTAVHIVRVPVEGMLYYLSLKAVIPGIMTFEGRNLDILSGITAVGVLGVLHAKWKMKTGLLLAWNIICLGLLVNIVVIAILSAPFPFQRFGFDQPNIAVVHFPFIYLPAVIVPLVLASHLVAIRRLIFQLQSADKNAIKQVLAQ